MALVYALEFGLACEETKLKLAFIDTAYAPKMPWFKKAWILVEFKSIVCPITHILSFWVLLWALTT